MAGKDTKTRANLGQLPRTPESSAHLGRLYAPGGGVIDGVLDATESLDVAAFRENAPSSLSFGGEQLPMVVTGKLRVSESLDVAAFVGEVDWSNDDEEFFLLSDVA